MERFLLLLMPLFSLAAESIDPAQFEGEIRKYEVMDRRSPPPAHPVLLVGSSSFRLWTNATTSFSEGPIVNRGFGGSTMADLLHYFDRIVVPYHPSVVIVYEGDNDLAEGGTPESVSRDFDAFLDRMDRMLPGTPVVLLAVKPCPSRRALQGAQRELNARLAQIPVHRKGTVFANTFDPLLGPDGEADPRFFESDQLHLNAEGYRRWQPVIAEALRRVGTRNATP